jgi:hypothetical protein
MEYKEYLFKYPSNSSISSSTSDEKLSEHLTTIASQINFYVGILIFFFGILGNILNILILSQRPLRSNTCVMIFLASSITGIITILSGLTTRILSRWDADISNSSRWVCKLRNFAVYTFRSVTFWLIMLAAIDRWIVSSRNARFRHLSSAKTVLRCIFIILVFSIIVHCQVFYCYELNLTNTPIKCFNKDEKCRFANDLIFAIVTILLPLTLIAIFGSMTILKIRSNQRRIIPVTAVSMIGPPTQIADHRQQRFKSTDRHLFIMLFIQVILLAFLTLPFAVQKLHATFTIDVKRTNLQTSIDTFIYQITLLMTYIATGMQFYVNTLSGGSAFRKATINLLQSIMRKIMCR